ncbi:hypothetical protein C8R44DRAFT_810936 [Mycena epipterygia]|nr:hypothetical protein C8R44DRAFT_810936 [Mycena epipterygia]
MLPQNQPTRKPTSPRLLHRPLRLAHGRGEEYNSGLYSEHEDPRPLGFARTIAGATEILKTLHDAREAKVVLKEGETRKEFAGLDASGNKGKVIGEAHVGGMEVRVEKWKVVEGKTVRLLRSRGLVALHGRRCAQSRRRGRYTCRHRALRVHDRLLVDGPLRRQRRAHVRGRRPQAIRSPRPGLRETSLQFPPPGTKDGMLVAEERDSKTKGKKYLGMVRGGG